MKGKNIKIDNPLFFIENISCNILPHYNLQGSKVELIKYKNTDKERAVYKIINGNNSYCLKKIYFPQNELLFIYSVLEWLNKHNINAPKLIPTIDNGRFVEYNNMIFILSRWISGTSCDFNNLKHILISSTELAKMHKCSTNFIPIENSTVKSAIKNNYIVTLKRFENLLQLSGIASVEKDIFSKKFLSCFKVYLELAEISLEIISDTNQTDLSKSICHGDYVNKNIIFTDEDKLYIIDFDKCCFDFIAHDIAYFLRRLLKRDKTKWNIDLALSFLRKYNSIYPLNQNDLKYIVSYLAFPQKYYKLSKDYYNKKVNKKDSIKLISKLSRNSINQLDFIHLITEIMNKINWNLNLYD